MGAISTEVAPIVCNQLGDLRRRWLVTLAAFDRIHPVAAALRGT
jgi:hypothetical protein